jgi:hypothetical protein
MANGLNGYQKSVKKAKKNKGLFYVNENRLYGGIVINNITDKLYDALYEIQILSDMIDIFEEEGVTGGEELEELLMKFYTYDLIIKDLVRELKE